MDWLDGKVLKEFIKSNPSQEARNKVGQAMWDFYDYQIHTLRQVHADPHPGNFIIGNDDTLGIIDFGCVKVIPDEFYNPYFKLLRKEMLSANNELEETFIQLQFIYEDDTRLILDDLEFAQPDITKHYVTENAASDIKHWTPGNHLLNTISTYKDKYIGATYGLQPFRPHFISQWSTAGLGFVDDKFTMEDDTGLIILEHPVTNQDYLISED